MHRTLRSLLASAAISALALTPPAIAILANSAAAQNARASDNAGGNRGDTSARGNSGNAGNQGGPVVSASVQGAAAAGTRGALASELQGLNAANASTTALANAAPDSQVGRIAIYRDSYTAAQEADAAYNALMDSIVALENALGGRSSEDIEAQIEALDTEGPDHGDILAALEGELAEVEGLESQLAPLNAQLEVVGPSRLEAFDDAEAARLAASGGRTLSDEALEELHRLLGF